MTGEVCVHTSANSLNLAGSQSKREKTLPRSYRNPSLIQGRV